MAFPRENSEIYTNNNLPLFPGEDSNCTAEEQQAQVHKSLSIEKFDIL